MQGDVDVSHELLARSVIGVSDRLAVAVDLSAAYLWEAVVPSGFGLEIDAQACAVATMRDGVRHRANGVRGRRLTFLDEHLTTLNGLLITTPARTWLDCAPFISPRDLVAMGDGMLRAEIASMDDFRKVIIWGRGRRGIRAARGTYEILDGRSESPGESWVRTVVIVGGLPRPTCNLTVVVDGHTFRLDIAWEDYKVALEYDGEQFHGPEQFAHDLWRRELLRTAGWHVIVVRKSDLAGRYLVDQARAALAARGYTG